MKWFAGLVIAILIAFAAVYVTSMNTPVPTLNTATSTPLATLKTYSSENYGVSFLYPRSYSVREFNLSKAGQEIYQIVVADTQALANAPQNGEGPTSITIDILSNSHQYASLEEWIQKTPQSNFQLSTDGKLASTTFAGIQGLSYTWDGLYRGESFAFTNGDHVLIASVTALTAQDAIRSDFQKLLESLVLQ